MDKTKLIVILALVSLVVISIVGAGLLFNRNSQRFDEELIRKARADVAMAVKGVGSQEELVRNLSKSGYVKIEEDVDESFRGKLAFRKYDKEHFISSGNGPHSKAVVVILGRAKNKDFPIDEIYVEVHGF